MRRWAVVLASLASVALAVHGQEPAPGPGPTFRAGVDIVQVDVSVLDRRRLPVQGLTAADFTVFEDGKPRPVTTFTPVSLPLRTLPSAAWMSDAGPDVQTNTFSREGRLVVIMMDRSISAAAAPVARQIARQAIDQLRPADLAAVVYTLQGMPQNFTADRALLRAAIDRPFATRPAGDDGSPAECYCGTCSLETVARVAGSFRDIPQRRKLLLIVGSNIAVQSAGRCGGLLQDVRTRAMRAADVANLTVYAFDPSALESLSPGAMAEGVPRDRPFAANLARQANLGVLPDRTGGRLIANSNAPERVLAELFRESDSYYVIGFQPATSRADGRFHEIDVKVNRRDVKVQARRGYYAADRVVRPVRGLVPKDIPPALASAVTGLWPRTDLPLSIDALPFASPDLSGTPRVALIVHVQPDTRGDGPADTASSPSRSETIESFSGAFDRNGRALQYGRQTLALTFPSPAPASSGYEVASQLALPHGRYEIRAAIHSVETGDSGSVYTYVDVPDFLRDPVSLSGLVLRADPSIAGLSADVLNGLVPATPTARRDFSRTDRVTAFVRIYQGISQPAIPVYVNTHVIDAADHVVIHEETRLLVDRFQARRWADYTFELPLTSMSAGEHLLRIQVTHGNDIVRRDSRFTVR